jgi:hypothetical protein
MDPKVDRDKSSGRTPNPHNDGGAEAPLCARMIDAFDESEIQISSIDWEILRLVPILMTA